MFILCPSLVLVKVQLLSDASFCSHLIVFSRPTAFRLIDIIRIIRTSFIWLIIGKISAGIGWFWIQPQVFWCLVVGVPSHVEPIGAHYGLTVVCTSPLFNLSAFLYLSVCPSLSLSLPVAVSLLVNIFICVLSQWLYLCSSSVKMIAIFLLVQSQQQSGWFRLQHSCQQKCSYEQVMIQQQQ